ncbi:MAG: hypothetical protein Fur0010_04130 [Bdellovibrio sp.]
MAAAMTELEIKSAEIKSVNDFIMYSYLMLQNVEISLISLGTIIKEN